MNDFDGTALPEIMENKDVVAVSAPRLDPADYLSDMEEFDLCEAQKIELLETLWSIMGSCARMGCARMGFGVDVCGLIFEGFNEAAAPESVGDILLASTAPETPSEDAGAGGIA